MHTKTKTVILTGSLIATFCSCAWLVSSMPRAESSANAAVALLASSQQVSRSDVEIALIRVGLDADALAAAGVTNANQVAGVVNAVRNQLVSSVSTVSSIEGISGADLFCRWVRGISAGEENLRYLADDLLLAKQAP